MNRVTLIQLRGNIPYTLSRIGDIDSKYNPMIFSISTNLERAPFYLMKCLEAPQSISQIPKESGGEGQYKIMLLYLIRNNIWFFIPGVSLKSRLFPWWPALPVIPRIIEDVLGMIVIIIKWCVPTIRTLLRIMAKLITNKAFAFPSTLRSGLPIEVIFR